MLALHIPLSGPTSSGRDLLASWAPWSLTLGMEEVTDTPSSPILSLDTGGTGKGRNYGEEILKNSSCALSFWRKELEVSATCGVHLLL